MSAVTSIAWTERTWNPTRGCSRVSEGCRNCYAERVAARFAGPRTLGKKSGGLGVVRPGPYAGLVEKHPSGKMRWTGKITLVPEALDEPLRWREPARIFVNSMSDLFHEDVPFDFIDRVFAVMALASQHTFQVLTKRPERMRAYLALPGVVQRWSLAMLSHSRCPRSFGGLTDEWFPRFARRIWLGVSVENQETAAERIPLLLQTPAAVRFVSVEPLLASVNLTKFHPPSPPDPRAIGVQRPAWNALSGRCTISGHPTNKLDWVIVGGESGSSARPCDVSWIRSIVAQCKAAGVPCFVKQLGARPVCSPDCPDILHGNPDCAVFRLRDRKGGDPEEWPADLRVREYPAARP